MEATIHSRYAHMLMHPGIRITKEMMESEEEWREYIALRQQEELLDRLKRALPAAIRMRQVLEMRFRQQMSLEQVGAAFGFTRERARQIERDAIKTIKAALRSNDTIAAEVSELLADIDRMKGIDGSIFH